MAYIRTVKRKKGTIYKAEIRVQGRSPLYQTFDRLSDAQRWAEDTEAILRSGGHVGETPPDDMPFSQALDKYELKISSQKRPNTRAREITSANALRAGFKGLSLKQITPAVVAAFRDKRLETIGPSTLQKDLALLSHLYTIARTEWALEINNPVAAIRKPAMPAGRLRLLSKDEARNLLEICRQSRNEKLYHYVQLLLHTGMRPSEGAGLCWGQISIDKRIIDLTVTKTEPRRVPLTIKAIEILLDIMPENCSRENRVFLPEKISATVQRRPNLFFRRAFDNAVKKAKIENFNMHDLRHTAASYLLMAGVDLRTLADILGHSTMQMVQRYTHLLDDHKIKAIDHIGNLGI
ncbi:site-specific integrase [Desulforhopalus sp. IMCC35007]|uniref:tyrosine-type recombinase/integrase n=1 Tax=Desulforhopalus sp. IMCC35007 TaxID=2569543 RepID=UPI0010AE5E89|nr:site-specific integrase [Desulforhopalus sp. IMCC35007]TKB08818.1 site-specific integrase [Desulforhopalus sp. IMCC35007]